MQINNYNLLDETIFALRSQCQRHQVLYVRHVGKQRRPRHTNYDDNEPNLRSKTKIIHLIVTFFFYVLNILPVSTGKVPEF